jgi:hypothetical protein
LVAPIYLLGRIVSIVSLFHTDSIYKLPGGVLRRNQS